MSLKVLVTDVIAQCGLDYLREKALEVDVHLGLSTEELIKIVPRYDALIVRSRTKVTRDVIDAGKNLKIIGRAGLSTENIDIAAASERGIIVCNVGGGNDHVPYAYVRAQCCSGKREHESRSVEPRAIHWH